MSTGRRPVLQTADNGNGGNQRIPCPLYGCKRVYTDVNSLQSHIKDHEIPAQSLPGKVLLCSTTGCNSSFPNMQKLMEHMRHHHKPNIFFLCESCRTKLRSYRGLLTHLHTCSKVPRGKTKTEATPPPANAVINLNTTSMAVDLKSSKLEAASTPQQQQQPTSAPPHPDAGPQPDSAALGTLNPEPSSPQITETAQLQPRVDPALPPAAAPTPPETQTQVQPQPQPPEPVPPAPASAPASAPQSPPGSAAVWKKGQGLACSRRILWEHTKGRYTCVQCGHVSTNRKDMTQHINTQHGSNKAAEDSATGT